MKLATGIDLLEIDRMRVAISVHGDRFLGRVFTPHELQVSADKVETLAGKFAAKEAVAKALGSGIGDISWKDIEILRTGNGAPTLILHGPAEVMARERGLVEWSLSISHEKRIAVAMVVAIGN